MEIITKPPEALALPWLSKSVISLVTLEGDVIICDGGKSLPPAVDCAVEDKEAVVEPLNDFCGDRVERLSTLRDKLDCWSMLEEDLLSRVEDFIELLSGEVALLLGDEPPTTV